MRVRRIVVFGATGKAGQKIVEQGLQTGLYVTAYIRQTALFMQHERLRIVQGRLDQPSDLHTALQEQDAIVSALGARDFTRYGPVVSGWLSHILPLAKATAVRRIIVIAGGGMLQADGHRLNRDLPSYPDTLRYVNSDHELAFRALQASHLNWTLICPPTLRDGAADGHYVSAMNYHPAHSVGWISTGNLAHCILEALVSDLFIHQRVGISQME